MSNGDAPKVNWVQVAINFVSIIVPILVILLIWGNSAENRLTRLEERSVTYVSNEAMARLLTDVAWMRDGQNALQSKQQEILQALNKFSAEIKALNNAH